MTKSSRGVNSSVVREFDYEHDYEHEHEHEHEIAGNLIFFIDIRFTLK